MNKKDYIVLNLEKVPDKSQANYPYGRHRGYVVGKICYKRKDNASIQQEDLEALKTVILGQCNSVIGQVGDEYAFVNYSCDSGD